MKLVPAFVVIGSLAAVISAGAQGSPCPPAGARTVQVVRELSGTPNATAGAAICVTLSPSAATVEHAAFPVAKPAGEADRVVYFQLDLPAAVPITWDAANPTRRPDTVLTLVAKSPQDLFSMAVYKKDGTTDGTSLADTFRPVAGTYTSRAEQQMLFSGNDLADPSYVVEVQWEEPATGTGGFSLVMTSQTPIEPGRSEMRENAPIVQAYASRRLLTGAEYDELITFATCDTADTSATNLCRSEVQQPTHVLFDRLVPRDVVEDEEPVVAFIGIGTANRIVLINKRGTKDTIVGGVSRNDVPAYTPRFRRTLPPARWFWALYIEDDQSPFETSIDVEFKPRATVSEVDEFDPSSLVSLGMKGAPNARRVVRIGMRRIRVRTPPVAVEIAFSRIGAGYGLRQWRQVYRMRSWNTFSYGVGVFVPVKALRVESHDLVEPGLASGDVPNFAVITPRWQRQPVFLMGEVYLPKARNMRDESVDRWQKFKGSITPHAIVGFGVPYDRVPSFFVGLGWNIGYEWLGITYGHVFSYESRLRDGYTAGQRLLDKQTPVDVFAYRKWTGPKAFGITIDVFHIR